MRSSRPPAARGGAGYNPPAMDLAEKLLVLAEAAATDGGQELVRALRGILAEITPFDAGEAVLGADDRILRWRLDDHDGPLLGADLVRYVGTLHAPLRLDDLDDASPFPETRRGMEALGLRSLLVLPLHGGEGGGALGVARRYGWAFVGTSLHRLWPVAGMAGVALRQAVRLTGLGRRVEALEADLERATATPNELRARRERGQAEAREREGAHGREHGSEQERSSLRAALGEQEARARGLRSRVEELEALLAESTRERDEAHREAQGGRSAAAEAGRASAESREEAAQAKADRERARAETERAKADGEGWRAQAASLGGELEESRREAEALRTRVAAEIPALEAESRALRSELETVRDEAARHLRVASRAQARRSALPERPRPKPRKRAPARGPKRPRSVGPRRSRRRAR